MKSTLIVVAALFFSANSLFAQKAKKEKFLDGVAYEINTQEENPKKVVKALPDVIKFKGGKLESELMEEKFKFEKGEFTYTVDSSDVENVKTHFNCDMLNEAGETLKWDGDMEEGNIEGKILWMKTDNKSKSDVIKKSFSFSGGLKKKR